MTILCSSEQQFSFSYINRSKIVVTVFHTYWQVRKEDFINLSDICHHTVISFKVVWDEDVFVWYIKRYGNRSKCLKKNELLTLESQVPSYYIWDTKVEQKKNFKVCNHQSALSTRGDLISIRMGHHLPTVLHHTFIFYSYCFYITYILTRGPPSHSFGVLVPLCNKRWRWTSITSSVCFVFSVCMMSI